MNERSPHDSSGILRSAVGSLRRRLEHALGAARRFCAPPGSRREGILRAGFHWVRARLRAALLIRSRGCSEVRTVVRRVTGSPGPAVLEVPPVSPPPPVTRHREAVDIVVCVHNALVDVRRCLESLVRTTFPPYRLILVDDGSDSETAAYLASFSEAQGAVLLRNPQARGYTCAANQGLAASSAPYVVLLNSDTVVTEWWLDRLVACAESSPDTGIVGPLSNTASWQSVPEVFGPDGDWSSNPLPDGVDIEGMAALVADSSARLYPRLPFLNGFCLLLRRSLLDTVGTLDEETFPYGYGEENDLCLRARAAGFTLAVADDAYVFHAQSRSYSDRRRRQLVASTDRALVAKHGAAVISRGVEACRNDLALLGSRSRVAAAVRRAQELEAIRRRWEGARVRVEVPPDAKPYLMERAFQVAEVLLTAGVDVRLALPEALRQTVELDPPHPAVPLQWTDGAQESADGVDGVVSGHALAAAGPLVDPFIFRPRPRRIGHRRLRLAACLPDAATRGPETAAAVAALKEVVRRRGDAVEVILVGIGDGDPLLRAPLAAFPWQRTAALSPRRRAALLGATDLFVEGRHDEAGAVSVVEAMASAAAVVTTAALPTGTPADDSRNALLTAAAHPGLLASAIERLVDDRTLLDTLRRQATLDAISHSVSGAAAGLLRQAVPIAPGRR